LQWEAAGIEFLAVDPHAQGIAAAQLPAHAGGQQILRGLKRPIGAALHAAGGIYDEQVSVGGSGRRRTVGLGPSSGASE